MLDLSDRLRRGGPSMRLVLLAWMLALWSCSGGGNSSPASSTSKTVTGPPLSITTTALPAGRTGAVYSTTLAASGGALPLSWSLTAGTLPSGLTLNASSGAISGTTAAAVNATALTFKVSDSSTATQSQSVTLKLTINPGSISVAVSPAAAGIPVSQALTVSATTNDFAGVTWSVSPAGGSFSVQQSASGANVVYTAPPTAGVYTLTATSVTDNTQTAATTVGVTDLAGVFTYHYDLARDGVNASEYALTPTNVNTAGFGKLFACQADGAVYAQPLWVASVTIAGSVHNVIYVATEHDSLFAFDADANPCKALWQVSLIDAAHGATAGEVTVPDTPTGYAVGVGEANINPEVGVTGTPVIDQASGTLYAVSKSMNTAATLFYQRLHAIDITSGAEKAGSPVTIAGSVAGNSGGGTTLAFSAQQENQRPGLVLADGVIYIGWASHEDAKPWYGWLMGYSYNTTNPSFCVALASGCFTQLYVLNTAPNAITVSGVQLNYGAGIWMSGGAPAVDESGSLYLLTGNGPFDGATDFGDAMLQLQPNQTSGTLSISSYFSPQDQSNDYYNDVDFGSGGTPLVLNVSSGALRHLVVGGGKDGDLYLLNGDAMGGSTQPSGLQEFGGGAGHGNFATPAFWNNTLFVGSVHTPLETYTFDPTTDLFVASGTGNTVVPSSQSAETFNWPGITPVVSVAASSATSAIVWALDSSAYCTAAGTGCGPAVLHAYTATNLATELWNSSMVATDAAGYAVRFTVPTVANGKVYIGTRGNNTGTPYTSGCNCGELDVYGLKP